MENIKNTIQQKSEQEQNEVKKPVITNLFEDMSPHVHDVESYEKLTQPSYKKNNE